MSRTATAGEPDPGPPDVAEDRSGDPDGAETGDADGMVAGAPAAAEPTSAPPTVSMGLALALGASAAAFLGAGSLTAGATGLVSLAVLVASLLTVSPRLCRLAGGVFVLAVAAGGVTGAGGAPLVGGTILAVVSWDVADHGLGLARHVGREAGSTRNELVHAAGSLAVGTVAGALAFGAFLVAGGGQPATALVFLLLGGIVLLVALRE